VSYGSIKIKGIDEILNDIRVFYSQNHPGTIFDKFVDGKITYKETIFEAKNHSDEEIEELRNYLKEFIEDVDKHFKWKNFFYCEWYLEFWRQKYIKKRFKRKSL
jgi:peptide methionine sulfoxide reductase MsrA